MTGASLEVDACVLNTVAGGPGTFDTAGGGDSDGVTNPDDLEITDSGDSNSKTD